MEVVVAFIVEELKIKRIPAVLMSLSIITVLSILCSLSLGILSDFTILGYSIFDLFDKLSANILMPIGGLLIVIFVGWRMKKEDFINKITNDGSLRIKKWFLYISYYSIKFIAPIVISIIMINALI